MAKQKKKKIEVNLLNLVPARVIDYEVDDCEIVTLLAPRFRNWLLKKLLEPRLKRPKLKVKLDDIGSCVWLNCDGNRNVRNIAEILRGRFEDGIEPRYERLADFFQQLERARFICFLNLDECLKADRGKEDA